MLFTRIFFIILLIIIKTAFVTPEIEIIAEGIDEIDDNDDIALIFYITVKNICKDELELSVNMLKCCESINPDEVDCNSMTLIGGDMGILPSMYIKNLTLIYPNLYLFNRRGICSIQVIYRNQLKKKETATDIHFDTTKSCPKLEDRKKLLCDTVDLDFQQNCNPVDCLIKYSGMMSYFNPECKRCQKVPICDSKIEDCYPDVAYSPYNNECGDLNIPIARKDLEDIENSAMKCSSSIGMINAICHYGQVTENGECSCNDEWTTSTNDEGMYEPGVAQQHLCNIQIGDWNGVNKSRIQITGILIGLFAITIISKLLLLMCLMTWCYKHFNKNKNKLEERTCTRQLDPEDNSIVLCDDEYDIFERCICGEYIAPSNKKSKNLHSQTVNVSYYYPCSGSFKSSGSDSLNNSEKTEQSIELSQTTVSSADDDDDDGADSNTGDEESDDSNAGTLFCDDQIGENLVYGVYCGLVDDDDDDEESAENAEETEQIEKVDK